jgi:spermidine synthase
VKSHWTADRKSPYESHNFAFHAKIAELQTGIQHLVILDTFSFGRALFLDSELQSAESDEFIYHEALVHPALCLHGSPRKVLILGGGEGATLREVLRHESVERAVMVEIDDMVIQACRQYLPEWSCGSFKDARTELKVCDAWKYLCEERECFDVVISDISELRREPFSFQQKASEFYSLVISHLNSGGLYCSQIHSVSIPDHHLFSVVLKTMRSSFACLKPYHALIPSMGHDLGFVVASAEKPFPRRSPSRIRKTLESSVKGPLRFYSAEIHDTLFRFPPWLASEMKLIR